MLEICAKRVKKFEGASRIVSQSSRPWVLQISIEIFARSSVRLIIQMSKAAIEVDIDVQSWYKLYHKITSFLGVFRSPLLVSLKHSCCLMEKSNIWFSSRHEQTRVSSSSQLLGWKQFSSSLVWVFYFVSHESVVIAKDFFPSAESNE